MGNSNKRGRDARLAKKREKKNLRERHGRRQRARQEGVAAYAKAAAARRARDDLRAVFLQEGAEPLTDELVRELVEEHGWEEKGLREAQVSGALYSRPRHSLLWMDIPSEPWSEDPQVRYSQYEAGGINPRLMLPWTVLPAEQHDQAITEAQTAGREVLEAEYDDLLEEGVLDNDSAADYGMNMVFIEYFDRDYAYWHGGRKPIDPRAAAFLEGWRGRRAEIEQERAAAARQPQRSREGRE